MVLLCVFVKVGFTIVILKKVLRNNVSEVTKVEVRERTMFFLCPPPVFENLPSVETTSSREESRLTTWWVCGGKERRLKLD